MTEPVASQLASYLNTVARLEPDVTPIDLTGAAGSIAISLRRIADALERANEINAEGRSRR